jgi:hypothetical protein
MRQWLWVGGLVAVCVVALMVDELDRAFRAGLLASAVGVLLLRDRLAPGLLAHNRERDRRAVVIFIGFMGLLVLVTLIVAAGRAAFG